MLILATAALPWLPALPWLLVAAAFVGTGLGHSWNAEMQVLRRILPTRRQWTVLSSMQIGLPLGILAASIIGPTNMTTFAAVLIGTAAIVLLNMNAIDREDMLSDSEAAMPQPDAPLATPPADTDPIADGRKSDVDASADPESESCGEEECCGGSRRAFETPAVWKGAALVCVGMVAAVAGILMTVSQTIDSAFSHPALHAAALVFGYGLLQTTAPRTGYVIASLPFLLSLAIAGIGLMVVSPAMIKVCSLLATACCGAIWAAFMAQPGELYTDCPPSYLRSRLLTSGLFSAAIVLLPVALLADRWTLSQLMVPVWLFIAVVGFAVLRLIPSPMMSSLGREDSSGADDEEYQDVVTALQKQN
ncbi:MAG: hypothetical protein Fues2KO_42050 [Fuerstiella sp.]